MKPLGGLQYDVKCVAANIAVVAQKARIRRVRQTAEDLGVPSGSGFACAGERGASGIRERLAFRGGAQIRELCHILVREAISKDRIPGGRAGAKDTGGVHHPPEFSFHVIAAKSAVRRHRRQTGQNGLAENQNALLAGLVKLVLEEIVAEIQILQRIDIVDLRHARGVVQRRLACKPGDRLRSAGLFAFVPIAENEDIDIADTENRLPTERAAFHVDGFNPRKPPQDSHRVPYVRSINGRVQISKWGNGRADHRAAKPKLYARPPSRNG